MRSIWLISKTVLIESVRRKEIYVIVLVASLMIGAVMTMDFFDLRGLAGTLRPRQAVACEISRRDGSRIATALTLRVDTAREADWIRAGGVLPYVAGRMLA